MELDGAVTVILRLAWVPECEVTVARVVHKDISTGPVRTMYRFTSVYLYTHLLYCSLQAARIGLQATCIPKIPQHMQVDKASRNSHFVPSDGMDL